MTARPHLPKYFPGYDTIMWMDADTWVQKWSAVELYFDRANTKGLAICQEMDRSYANIYALNNSRELFFNSLKACFEEKTMARVFWMPMVNSGVFAMRADSHYWSEWRDTLGAALQRSKLDHFTEQTSLLSTAACRFRISCRPDSIGSASIHFPSLIRVNRCMSSLLLPTTKSA
jgi:hypothetical protein